MATSQSRMTRQASSVLAGLSLLMFAVTSLVQINRRPLFITSPRGRRKLSRPRSVCCQSHFFRIIGGINVGHALRSLSLQLQDSLLS